MPVREGDSKDGGDLVCLNLHPFRVQLAILINVSRILVNEFVFLAVRDGGNADDAARERTFQIAIVLFRVFSEERDTRGIDAPEIYVEGVFLLLEEP